MADSFKETKHELFELMQRMHRSNYASPTPEGVTPSEARTMVAIDELHRLRGETRPGRVAQFTHTTPSALSQTFRSLEKKGLIERHRSGGDFRGVTVKLTEKGKRFAIESKKLHDKHMDEVMAYVGEEDMAHLVRILRKVAEFHEFEGGKDVSSRAEGGTGGPPSPATGSDAAVPERATDGLEIDEVESNPEGGDVPCA